MIKNCVKKPFIVVVAVIIIMIIGGVSVTNMQTDLIPSMELPYMLVITTEPGASPEKVQTDISEPMESKLGTISGLENIRSTSSENYSMVMMEFSDDTDMEAALVRVSQALNSLELPEECGTPNIMEVSMDMMATMYATVEYDGKDIKEITNFTEDILKPYLERQEGVASISVSGSVEDSVEIRLNKKKINKINDKILYNTNKTLADSQKKLDDAKSQLASSKAELEKKQNELGSQQSSTNKKIADGSVKISQAQATKAAYEASLNSMKASQTALTAEKKAYEDAKLADTYKTLNTTLAGMKATMGDLAKMQGITVPANVKEAIDDPENYNKFLNMLKTAGYGDQVKNLKLKNLKKIYNIVEVRIPQIETELANLKTEIAGAEAIVSNLEKKMKGLDDQQSEVIAGGLDAAAGFGSGNAQIAAGITQISTAEADIEKGQTDLDNAKEAAIENSNIEGLLSLDALSGIIVAQNFSMPAGYVDDKDGNQWLIKIGENYTTAKQLKKMVLTKVPGVGVIRLSDVADVTTIDNLGDTYSKINGNNAILLSIYKTSTANTSEVSDNVRDAFEELEADNKGLELTPMVDQADYITRMIDSILSSILFGAILAILVLALFLKSVKPTIIVAFSIPFSVLFAIVLMYFSDMTLNMMTLAALCLSIGMLVDNSIVVVENIYRLRDKGIKPARAAVQGAKQVGAPIIASTITTICVFLPMVFVTGMVSQLLIPFALTITYALVASLVVALTVVPTFTSFNNKNFKPKQHKIFDRIQNVYGKSLQFCLKRKFVPLLIAIGLLAVFTFQAFRTGLEMMGTMSNSQISVTMILESDVDKDTAYETADKASDILKGIEGITKVAVMDGNATVAASSLGSTTNNFTQFMFFVIPGDDVTTTAEIQSLEKNIEEKLSGLEYKDLQVGSSNASMSSLTGSGLQVNIYGDEQEQLIKISHDVMDIMNGIEGCENADNGIADSDKQLQLNIDKDKVAKNGLTVAQIFQQIAGKLTTEKTSITLTKDSKDTKVNIVDERNKLKKGNILNTEITATVTDATGKQEKKTYKLSKFATVEEKDSPKSLTRLNQTNFLTVSSETKEGYNTTLLSRQLEEKLEEYKAPYGYTVEIRGESEQVMNMMYQLLLAVLLGFVLIYLVMVAQFQSLLSPFIILFTIPLAFTGGMIGLVIYGETISAIAMMGFMILMGTVVNNGIVFVDYANQLRIQGMEKRPALIATGKTRMRPILMTALTTILSMSVMVFSQDAGNAMQKPMAIVVAFGLLYATFMTLYIVPVLYDVFYRRKPKVVDVGEDNLEEELNEAQDFIKNNA